MGKRRKFDETELKNHWVCEDLQCGEVFVGDDPPDACPKCGHKYFENLHDLVASLPRATIDA